MVIRHPGVRDRDPWGLAVPLGVQRRPLPAAALRLSHGAALHLRRRTVQIDARLLGCRPQQETQLQQPQAPPGQPPRGSRSSSLHPNRSTIRTKGEHFDLTGKLNRDTGKR